MLDRIESSELMCEIVAFLTPRDLLTFEAISRQFQANEYLSLIWLKLCKEKWGIKLSETNFRVEPSRKFKLLFFYSKSIPDELICTDANMLMTGTQVRFSGIVGENNRSVKSIVPFPAMEERASDFAMGVAYLLDTVFCLKIKKLSVTMCSMISNAYNGRYRGRHGSRGCSRVYYRIIGHNLILVLLLVSTTTTSFYSSFTTSINMSKANDACIYQRNTSNQII